MTVASYERDPAEPGECLIPVVPKIIASTTPGNHHIDAPHNTTHPAEHQVTKRSTKTP